MTAPFLPNAAYTNGRAALEGAYKRHAFFAGRGVALVAGCLGGRVGDGGGLVAGRSRGPRLRVDSRVAEIVRYARFSAAAVSRDLGFSFPPPKTTA